jgi:hypothetical protein
MKKSMKERMEEASLKELMPEFDKELEWGNLSSRLHPKVQTKAHMWKRAAAILAIITTGAIAAYVAGSSNTEQNIQAQSAIAQKWPTNVIPEIPEIHTYSNNVIAGSMSGNEERQPETGSENNTIPEKSVKPSTRPKGYVNETHRTKEFVCNGTPCPLEICIIQTIKCKNQAPTAISTCNTLEPDQARQLHYKAPEGDGGQCKVTIDEIRIKRVTTGETIVLNAHSKPSTAEELFNCMTGREKCGLLAGIFEADCNNQQKTHSLKIDNNSGNLIMQ